MSAGSEIMHNREQVTSCELCTVVCLKILFVWDRVLCDFGRVHVLEISDLWTLDDDDSMFLKNVRI
jgi:hypothetical protein